MIHRILCSLLAAPALACMLCHSAAAAPVALAAVSRQGRLQFTVTPGQAAPGCTYSLYGAAGRGVLTRNPAGGTLLASASSDSGAALTFTAPRPSAPAAVRGRPRRSFFFAAQAVCGTGDQAASPVRKVAVPAARRGISAAAWLDAVAAQLTSGSAAAVPRLTDAFPALTFAAPIGVTNAGDGSGRLFVIEQGGTIRVLGVAAASAPVFLDISPLLVSGGEQGLLGVAFHPQYRVNHLFFVNYTAAGSGATVIARYSASAADPNTADPASAVEILRIPQPFANHNGGQLAFGPDGYLYIGMGDGGGEGDPQGNGQNRSVLLGKILRIDVDHAAGGMSYAIPPDNPFAGNTQGFREEIFAYGFRNPWRFSFDAVTGRLWAGDVGQDREEEIDVVEKGGNYGWNILEGTLCFNPPSGCSRAGLAPPITEYDHSQGIAVIGGFVFRGSGIPALTGRYVYGDFGSGRIWTLPADAGPGTAAALLLESGLRISSFGTGEQQQLYVVDQASGKVFEFTP